MRKSRIEFLIKILKILLLSKPKSFECLEDKRENGVYVVYSDRKPIYVGSTVTEHHCRIGDLDNHYTNHTLHKKLLKEKLRRHLKEHNIPNRTRDLVRLVGRRRYERADVKVKDMIRKKFKYTFYEMVRVKPEDIKRFEHFCIAYLNTTSQYNG
jgi:hypothetical protein